MSKIKEGMRVVAVIDNELQKGTVKSVYDWSNIAVVALDNGNTEKLNLWELGIEPVVDPEKDQESKKIEEPFELSEITLTHDEYREKVANLVTNLILDDKIDSKLGKLFIVFSVDLAKRLFCEKTKND